MIYEVSVDGKPHRLQLDRAEGRWNCTLDSKPVTIRSPRDAIDRGIFLVPEDRKRSGLVLDHSVNDNISLPNLMAFASGLLIRRGVVRPSSPAHDGRQHPRQ